MCADTGVKLVYLPPPSPDFNPIEEFLAELPEHPLTGVTTNTVQLFLEHQLPRYTSSYWEFYLGTVVSGDSITSYMWYVVIKKSLAVDIFPVLIIRLILPCPA